jgi:hypothetical protein
LLFGVVVQTYLLTTGKKSSLDLAIPQNLTELLTEYFLKIDSVVFPLQIQAVRDSFVGGQSEKTHFVLPEQLHEETGVVAKKGLNSLLMLGFLADSEKVFLCVEGVFLCFKYHLYYTCQIRAR